MISTSLSTPADSLPEDSSDRQPTPNLTPPTTNPDPSTAEPASVTLAQVLQSGQPLPRDRETLKVILVGSRNTVNQTIRQLHKLGFAEAGAWSPLLPMASQGQFISMLNRYWLKQD